MKRDQEQKIHVCKFCKQSFSNGKKLGGHMRGHLALISASRETVTRENWQESNNGEKGVHVFDVAYDNRVIKTSESIDQGYQLNGRKQGIRVFDREVINGEMGFDEDDDELIKKSQQRLYIDEDYDANGRKQWIQEHDQEAVSGQKVLSFDDDNDEKKSRQTIDFEQDYGANVYVLRENPKRSWRVSNSNSSKVLATHKRCHSRKESIKNIVCEKCGKGFQSMKALYGHMRCHSIKKSQPLDESSTLSSSEEKEHEDEDEDDDDGVANPVRKKRSCTRYKSPKPNHFSTSLSSSGGDEDIDGAMNLMMLSRGVKSLDGVTLVISHAYSTTVENYVGVDISDDGSMEFCKFKNNSELGLKNDLVAGYGSGQLNMGRVGSSLAKRKPTNEDFRRRSKDHKCPICFKEYASVQGLARHERVHNKTKT